MKRRNFLRSAPGLLALPYIAQTGSSVQEGLGRISGIARSLPDDAFWREVRKGFLLNPGVAHFNCGTLGATPSLVLDAIGATMRKIEGNPAVNVFGPVGALMEEVRGQAAEFLGSDVDEIVLTRNTTEGMNMVAEGIAFNPGDEVLTTNHEHPGGRVGWEHAAKHRGVRIVEVPLPAPAPDEDALVSLIERGISDRTRVISLSHVCTVTGLIMPLARIAAITRPRGILLVCDGAQAPGMLDVDVKTLGVDTYASSSHKWMLASKGSGLLYLRSAVQDQIQPVFLHSGRGAYTASSGTRNVAQIVGHGVAMAFHNQIGRDRVESRCRSLGGYLREGLRALPGVRLLTPDDSRRSCGIVSVALSSASNRDVAGALREEDIVVKVIPKAEYNGLRFSTHIYNSEREIDRLVAALRPLLPAN